MRLIDGGAFHGLTSPDGQRITAFSIFAFLPKPKNGATASFQIPEKPLPPDTSCRLLLAIPEKRYLRADGTAIAAGAFEFELDPLIFGSDRILINQQGTALIGNDNVKHATSSKVNQCHGSSIVSVGDPTDLCDVHDRLARSVVHPNALVLIARQAPPFRRANSWRRR